MVKVNQQQSAGFMPNGMPYQSSLSHHQASFNENQSLPASNQPKGLFQLPPQLLQWLPLLPLLLEQATGQKIPPMGGTMGEIQSALSQMQFNLSQLLNHQQQIFSRLESLENNASQQLNNLSQQVASTNQAFRLMHQKETKSLEFNPPPLPESNYPTPE